MTEDLKRFFLYAAILFIVAISVSQIFFLSIFETFCFPARIISIVFVWVATCASHFWVMKTVTDKPKAFNRVFMLQTALKLFMYLVFIVIYLNLFKEHGVPFTIHFFVVYLFFAIFEVSMILKFVKEKSGQKSGSVEKSN